MFFDLIMLECMHPSLLSSLHKIFIDCKLRKVLWQQNIEPDVVTAIEWLLHTTFITTFLQFVAGNYRVTVKKGTVHETINRTVLALFLRVLLMHSSIHYIHTANP